MDPPCPLPSRCPQCGAPLAADVPAGLCLRCLLDLGLQRDEDGSGGVAESAAAADVSAGDFDRYRVLEQIGEGGCGVVYRAEQLVPVRREVALKVIKLGMDTRAVIARFEAERQALAMMDHPHIARVFDAGATRSGRPFFAMELVRGERITDYCDRRRLTIRRRLELFVQVCHAVQHAHQKGIIHRDLKPSNILVVETDGVPAPKVIDFGIAKATARRRLAGQTLYTAFEQFIGTPAYMSPEQAGVTGDDVDTRTDIYALGVLLYELLTGRPPFDPERLQRAAVDEICRIIREEEPVRPSERVTTLAAADLTNAARLRVVAPPKLAGELRGDLDWLVLKAIEKEPARRYATAGDLAADLQRHLGDEPIAAGPPGAWYRLGKFARRHRVAVVAGGAVLLALLGGLGLSTWFYLREKEARRLTEARAYASDMGLAARMASQLQGLGGVARLLAGWAECEPDRRGWEWYYLNGLCHEAELTIGAGSAGLLGVAWSPDGARLAAAGAGGRVLVFDARTGKQLGHLRGHAGEVFAVAWSRDGRRLATAGADGTARIWEVGRGFELAALRGPGGPAITIAWSPDDRVLAAAYPHEVKLWDTAGGGELSSFRVPAIPNAVAWSHDGSRLAAVGNNGLRIVWSLPGGTARLDHAPRAEDAHMKTVAWSPDDRLLATGCNDFTVRFFDAATGVETATCWEHCSGVSAVAWSPDGNRLASADMLDGSVRIWEVAGRRVLRTLRGHHGGVKAVSWQPGGNRVASAGADGTIRIWDADHDNRSQRVIRHPNQVLSLAWHPDNRHLAAGGRCQSAVIWDTRSSAGPLERAMPVTMVWQVAWNSSGSCLAAAGDGGLIRLWNEDGRQAGELRIATESVRALAWNPAGTRLAISGAGCGLQIWDLQSANTTVVDPLERMLICSVAWSADGKLLAAAAGARIMVFDLHGGRPPRQLAGHADAVRSLAWSPDSRQLASAGDDSLARIWDVASGRELAVLTGHAAPVRAVAWHPTGTRVATGSWDRTVKLWEPATGIELCLMDEHPAQVAAVAFSPDGVCLASSDLDGNMIIRDATPGCGAGRRRLLAGGAEPAGPAMADHRPAGTMDSDPGARARQRLVWYRDTAERCLRRGDLHAHRMLVRFLASCPDPELRDGRRAVELGEQAAALSRRNNVGILDDLAAAYAETGDFAKAISVQQEAIALLHNPRAKARLITQLRRYQANLPDREP